MEIRDNIFIVTVDNASSNEVVVRYFKNKLKSLLILGGDFFHLRCATHLLNLIVKDVLIKINESIARIRTAVKYVIRSPPRAKTFEECIKKKKE